MYSLAFKKFIRAKATILGLACIVFAGLISLFIGRLFLKHQQDAVELTAIHQQQTISKNLKFFGKETGLLLYYLRFSLVNRPDRLSGISIGQRDINPSIQSVTIRNLENQKYDTDLNNPSNLLLGNLDFGFVIIYLFPLLIIAFTYNLLSEEKDCGTWNMIRLHAASPLGFLRRKIMLRMQVIYALGIFLMVIGIVLLSIQLTAILLAVALLFALYLLFWFSLSYWVISWQKNSAFNAICLLAFWVVLTILSPALVNSYISTAYPVPEALQTALKQRQGSHEKWDMEIEKTMTPFLAHYPQYAKYPMPESKSSWFWYYAMQQMGDDEALGKSKELRDKLLLREKVSNRIAMVLPVLHTQLRLNSLAGSDLGNHLLFLDSTQRFHEKLRLFFYPRIIEERAADNINWKSFTVEYFSYSQRVSWTQLMLPLIIFSGILFWLGGYTFFHKGNNK